MRRETATEARLREAARAYVLKHDQKAEKPDWRPSGGGYRYARSPVGYSALLTPEPEGFRLVVRSSAAGVLFDRIGVQRGDLVSYLEAAADAVCDQIRKHRATIPKGTLAKLSVKQAAVLRRNGHDDNAIDCLPYQEARDLIGRYMYEYHERMGH